MGDLLALLGTSMGGDGALTILGVDRLTGTDNTGDGLTYWH